MCVELQTSVMCGPGKHCKKFPREIVREMQRAARLKRRRQQQTWSRMRVKDELQAKDTVSRVPTDANVIKPLESIRTRRQNLCHNPENPRCGNHPHQVELSLGDSDNLRNVALDSYRGLGYSSYNHDPNASSNHFASNDVVSIKVEPGLEDSSDIFTDFSVPVLASNHNPSQSNPSSYPEDTVRVKLERAGGGSEGEFCVPVYNNCVKSDLDGDAAEVSQCDGSSSSSSSSSSAAAATTDVCYSLRTRQVYRPINKQVRRRRRRI